MKSVDSLILPLAVALGVVMGAAVGYAFGYDHGWERAVAHMQAGGDGVSRIPANFEECVAAGHPIMKSYPPQCRVPGGPLYVQEIPETDERRIGRISGGCAIGGCSGQLCTDADEAAGLVTTCEFRPEYACYNSARCERQADGVCGWAQTSELATCLSNPSPIE